MNSFEVQGNDRHLLVMIAIARIFCHCYKTRSIVPNQDLIIVMHYHID